MTDSVTPALFHTLLDAFIRHITAPLIERIEALEKAPAAFAFEPTPEFIEKVRDAVLADDAFDDAVVGVMGNRATEVVGELEDDIKKLDCSDVGDKVSEVISRGSFSIDFSAY